MPKRSGHNMLQKHRFLTAFCMFVIITTVLVTITVLLIIFTKELNAILLAALTASGLGLVVSSVFLYLSTIDQLKENRIYLKKLETVSGITYWEFHADSNTVVAGKTAIPVPDFHPARFGDPAEYTNRLNKACQNDVLNCLTSTDQSVKSVIFQFERGANDTVLVECISHPLLENNNHIGRYGVIKDVTQTRLQQDATRKKLEKTEKALHLSQMFEWEIDLEMQTITIFSSYSTILFLEPGKQTFTYEEFFSRVDQQSRKKALQHLTSKDSSEDPPPELELRFNRIDGEALYLKMFSIEETDQSGFVKKRFGIAQDISHLRETEIALEESEKQKNLVIDNIPIGLALWTPERHLIWANKKLFELYGQPDKSGNRGELCYRVLSVGCDICDSCPVLDAIKQRQPVASDLSVETRTLSVKAVPFIDRYGEVASVITIVNDVSLEKQLHEQLSQLNKMEAIASLASGIAQDFNQTFQIIWNCVEGAMEVCDETAMERLEPIAGVIQNGHDLVNQLLRFSGEESVMQPVQINVTEFLESFAEKFKSGINDSTEFSISLYPGISNIFADPNVLKDILENVLDNAIEALYESGKIRIQAQQSPLPPELMVHHEDVPFKEFICVTISDNGVGIPKADVNKIFNPYYTTKSSKHKSGAGLSSVYANMRRHNGIIQVNSVENEGTQVHLYFPVYSSLDVDTRELLTSISNTSDTDTVTILLVDDDPTVRTINSSLLQKRGYNVIEASDGKTAIDLFTIHADTIHLVILDLVLPRYSGYDVYEYIRKIRPDTQVLFATGYSAEYLEKLPPKSIVMQKPISPETLMENIKLALIKKHQ